MAATPNEPNILKTPTADDYRNGNQPPARIIENKPASTVAQALANGKAQVAAAK